MIPSTSSGGGRGRRAAVDFLVYFGCGGIYMVGFFLPFLYLLTLTAYCKYEDDWPHLSLY